jgi:hypothetical protein
MQFSMARQRYSAAVEATFSSSVRRIHRSKGLEAKSATFFLPFFLSFFHGGQARPSQLRTYYVSRASTTGRSGSRK